MLLGRHICLLDSMHIDLMDMDLFTATRVHGNNQSEFSYKSQVGLSVCLSPCLAICLSACLSICLSVCLSLRVDINFLHCIFLVAGLKAAKGEGQTKFNSRAQLGLGI